MPAHADTPFSCPAPRSVFRDKTQPIHQPSVATGGDIDLEGDKIIAGTNGNATATGRVVARQGQRGGEVRGCRIRQRNKDVRVRGKIDYEDPLIT